MYPVLMITPSVSPKKLVHLPFLHTATIKTDEYMDMSRQVRKASNRLQSDKQQ